MAMDVVASKGNVAKPPPPPPWLQKATTYDSSSSYTSGTRPGARTTSSSSGTATATARATAAEVNQRRRRRHGGTTVLLLRATAALMAFVAVALVASCRHGDWMEFGRYPEYRCLLGASVVACVYSAAQAIRNLRRRMMLRASYDEDGTAASGSGGGGLLVDFAGDQAVAYVLMTASSAALPITLRMRSAVINVFTDAMVAAITLGFVAFAALALSAMISGFRLAAAAAAEY
ncbi:hypothetical protein BS78_K162800 [Paspalum vaginatum]|uniref:CASP-like protein n=1 Tax=Paspalum vaginatum TaxID=158149 RepID=A0A9W7XCH9_9POAL|nr:hypothetical protein BS78_K162800 [Paspalum vaginatum]